MTEAILNMETKYLSSLRLQARLFSSFRRGGACCGLHIRSGGHDRRPGVVRTGRLGCGEL